MPFNERECRGTALAGRGGTAFKTENQVFPQPLKFHLEPSELFIKLCFLRLLLSLLALAVRSEDVGTVFQQLPFPGFYLIGMNLVFTR